LNDNPAAMNTPPFQQLDAAIVDLDGTLVDTVGDFEVALRLALADIGLPPVGRAFISRTVGKGSEHLLQRSLAEVGAPAALFDELWSRYQHHYLGINGQYADVFPGALEGLRRLQGAGLRLACLTNKPTSFALPLLGAKGLAPFFQHIFGGDAFERKKPDPLPLQKTCEALGTLPARTLMIGDSSNDARAARAAGCPVVLASYGYNHGEPITSAGADAIYDRIDAVVWPPT
jgi:phosphoglycolate phosphatase